MSRYAMFESLDSHQTRCYCVVSIPPIVQSPESAIIVNEPQQAGPPNPDPSTAPKPALSLRIGITGLRRLRADQIVRIERQMGDVLDLVRVDMETLAQSSNVCPFYACEPNSTPVPLLRMVSPIARGADRVAAIAALNRGYKLFVPMPFAHDEYVKDFTGSDPDHPEEVPLTAQQDQEQFRDLLNDAAGTIQLDGGRRLFPTDTNNSFEGFSYEVVGHFVVRHCDLLVAIWDGKVSHGRGGTADIVRYAAVVGLPVWWIHATTPCEPGWLAERHDWRDIDPTQPQPEERKILSATSKLRTHLERLVLMPDMVSRRKHGSQSKDLDEPQPSPARIYFDEQPDTGTGIWTTYSKVMSIFRPRRLNVPSGPAPAVLQLGAMQQHWQNLYAPADARAGEYAARYRSSYVLIIALATLALALGAFAIGVGVARETGFPTIPI